MTSWEKKLTALARETGFIKRQRKLTAQGFLMAMTFGRVSTSHPSLSSLADTLDVPIRRESLSERFTNQAVLFLKAVLSRIIELQLTSAALDTAFLRPFQRVILIDSSSWDIHPNLAPLFPGSGGSASTANCKLHLGYDYKNGSLRLCELTPGTTPDNHYTKNIPDHIQPDDLVIFDLGYAALGTFQALHAKGAFFLSRLNLNTNVYHPQTGQEIKLAPFLSSQSADLVTLEVGIGAKKASRVTCRLIAFRMNGQIAEKRRRKLTQEARKKGYQKQSRHYDLAAWTIMITNVDEANLHAEAVWLLYITRWYVELVFKQLKSVLRLHRTSTSQGPRFTCEVYGTLIVAAFIVISHGCLNAFMWNNGRREVSIEKFTKRIQQRSYFIMKMIQVSQNGVVSYLIQEYGALIRNCLKGIQRSRTTSLQQLHLYAKKGISMTIYAA